MHAIIDAALSHARTVIASLFFLLIAGATAYVTIPKEADPDINIPQIYVSMNHEGISPEDAERLLLRPMEVELRGIEGVKEMRATAFEGGANIVLEFEAGFDADLALTDVRDKVDRAKPELPEETDEPTVTEINLSLLPVLVVTLSGEVPERTLLRLARELRDRIEEIGAVLEADIAGDREELVEILIDPLVLESYGLDAVALNESISRNNLLVAAGALDTGRGRFSMKVPGLLQGLNDILNLPLKADSDAVVTVGDIATVRRTFKDPEGFARINGAPALALEISKRTGENIIDTIEAVRGVVDEARADWPETLRVTYSQDKSTDIRTMLKDLQNNVISAILLVMIVVVAALGPRSALLVGLAVPGSFLTGILVLDMMGLTVNIVVLFSLILAVGMLVDGAIVVTEYADRRLAEGASRRDAYAEAAKRMAWPITASTATTLAAFLPLVFWPGVVGEFMKFLPITLLVTLSASLLMALIFVPTLGSLIARRDTKAMKSGGLDDHRDGLTGLYLRGLHAALKRPVAVLVGALVLLVGVYMIYGMFGRGVEFFPDVEPENAVIQVHARGNMSIHERDALVREVEDQILEIQRERWEFDSIYARSVARVEGGQDAAEDVIGSIQLEFAEWETRRPAQVILEDIRARTAHLAGVIVEPRKQEAGPPVGKPVQIELSSRRPELLPSATETIRAIFERTPGLVDIEDSRPVPGIEQKLTVDRPLAARFGADVALIGNYVKLITNGLKFTDFRPSDSDDEVDIVARFPERHRSLDQLDRVLLKTDRGLVPMGTFVKREAQQKTGDLTRVDGRRVMTVKADVAPGVLPDQIVTSLREDLIAAGIDPRVHLAFKGEDEEQKEAQEFLSQAFLVALFMMALILVTQFNSFYSAGLILSAVIMSTLGVMVGLLITGQPFGIVMSGIGVIALAGIVVNNNIVLIDTFDRIRTEEPDPMAAILLTGAERLRPVLLTTVTTVLGLMPMVLMMNIDFVTREVAVGAPSTQWWVQLSTGIVFGLSFATLLTLVVTPCALMLRERLRSRRERRAGNHLAAAE